MIITANALPVYGAVIGKLVFFQVLYLYWVESFLLIFFDNIRIMAARGNTVPSDGINVRLINAMMNREAGTPEHWNFFKRLWLVIRTSIIRTLILLFYMVFIVAFIAFQVTDKGHRHDILDTVLFRNQFFNYSLIAFLINAAVQLISGFFLSGNYKSDSPRQFTAPFDGRTILMHVMIVGSVFIHQYFFAGKSYASKGEIVYIGLFMLIKTIADLFHLRSRVEANADAPAFI